LYEFFLTHSTLKWLFPTVNQLVTFMVIFSCQLFQTHFTLVWLPDVYPLVAFKVTFSSESFKHFSHGCDRTWSEIKKRWKIKQTNKQNIIKVLYLAYTTINEFIYKIDDAEVSLKMKVINSEILHIQWYEFFTLWGLD